MPQSTNSVDSEKLLAHLWIQNVTSIPAALHWSLCRGTRNSGNSRGKNEIRESSFLGKYEKNNPLLKTKEEKNSIINQLNDYHEIFCKACILQGIKRFYRYLVKVKIISDCLTYCNRMSSQPRHRL